MHNWNLAILEHLGLLTREQAQKLSDEVKIRIHKENYKEAYDEVQAILGDTGVLKEFASLRADVAGLKAKSPPTVVKKVAPIRTT